MLLRDTYIELYDQSQTVGYHGYNSGEYDDDDSDNNMAKQRWRLSEGEHRVLDNLRVTTTAIYLTSVKTLELFWSYGRPAFTKAQYTSKRLNSTQMDGWFELS